MIKIDVIWSDGADILDIFFCKLPTLPRIGETINVFDIDMSVIGLDKDHPLSEFDDLIVQNIIYKPGHDVVEVYCKTRWPSQR